MNGISPDRSEQSTNLAENSFLCFFSDSADSSVQHCAQRGDGQFDLEQNVGKYFYLSNDFQSLQG